MRRLLLIPLLALGLVSADALAAGPAASTFNGRISGLDSATITVRDGKRTATCFLTGASPSVASFVTGDHVKLACRDHNLVAISLKSPAAPAPKTSAPDATPSTTTTTTTTANAPAPAPVTTNVTTPEQQTSSTGSAGASGVITSLTTTSITVNVEHPLTCSLGPNAASTAGYEVGDSVKIGCLNGLLYYIVGPNGTSVSPLAPKSTATTTTTATATAATTTTTTTTEPIVTSGSGTITALSSTSVTVAGDRTLTCAIGPSSPSPASYGLGVGSRVVMYCLNGALYRISAAPATATTTTTTTSTTTPATTTPQSTSASASGTITALTSTSVTVTGDHALTCSIGSSSPNPASYGLAVGAHLTITCVNNVLTHVSSV